MAIEHTHEPDAETAARVVISNRPIRQLPKKATKGTVAPRPPVENAPPTVKVRLVWKSQNVDFVREISRERLQKRALSDDEDDLDDRPQKRRNTRTDEALEQVVSSLHNVAIADGGPPKDEGSATTSGLQVAEDDVNDVEMSGKMHETAAEEERSVPSLQRVATAEENTTDADELETEDQQGNDADNENEESEKDEEGSQCEDGDDEVRPKEQSERGYGEEADKEVELVKDERQKTEQDDDTRGSGDRHESTQSTQVEGLPYRHEHKNYDGDSDEDASGEGQMLKTPQTADGSHPKGKGKQRECAAVATADPCYAEDAGARSTTRRYVYDQFLVDLELERATQRPDACCDISDRGEGPSRQSNTAWEVAPPKVSAAPQLLRPIARRPGAPVMVPKPPEAYPRLAPLTEEMIRQRNAEELQKRAAEKLQHLTSPGMRSRGRVHQVDSDAAQPSAIARPTSHDDPIRRPSGPRLDRSLSTSPYRLLKEARKLIESDWEKSKAAKKAASLTASAEEEKSEDLTFGLDGLHIRDEEPGRGASRVRSLLKSALRNNRHKRGKPGRVRFAPRMEEASPAQVDQTEKSNAEADRRPHASVDQEGSSTISSSAGASHRDDATNKDGAKTNGAHMTRTAEEPGATATGEQPSSEPRPEVSSSTEEDEKPATAVLATETNSADVLSSAQARPPWSSQDADPLTASTSAAQATIIDTPGPANIIALTLHPAEKGSSLTVPSPEPVDATVPGVTPAGADLGSSTVIRYSQPAEESYVTATSSVPLFAGEPDVTGTGSLSRVDPQVELTAPCIDSEMEMDTFALPNASTSTQGAAPPYAATFPQGFTHDGFDMWSAFGAQDPTAQLPPSLAAAAPELDPCPPSIAQWAPPAVDFSRLSQHTNGYDGTWTGDGAVGGSSGAFPQLTLDGVLDPATLHQLAYMAAMQGISIEELLSGGTAAQQSQESVVSPPSGHDEGEAWRHNPYYGYIGSDSEVFRIGETDNGTPLYEMTVGRDALICLHTLIFGDVADGRDWAMFSALPENMRMALLLWPEPDWITLESILAEGPCQVRWEYRDPAEKIVSSHMELDAAVASTSDPDQDAADNPFPQPQATAVGSEDAACGVYMGGMLAATDSALETGQEEPSTHVEERPVQALEPGTTAKEHVPVVGDPSLDHCKGEAPPSLVAEESAPPATQSSASVNNAPAMPAHEAQALAPPQPTLVSSPPVCPTPHSPKPPPESGPGYTLDDITLAVIEVYVRLEYDHCTQPALFDATAPFPPADGLPPPTLDEALRKELLSVREAERLMREAIQTARCR